MLEGIIIFSWNSSERNHSEYFSVTRIVLGKFVESCNMDYLMPSSTPMVPNQDLVLEEVIEKPKEYRRVIGLLQFHTLAYETRNSIYCQ